MAYLGNTLQVAFPSYRNIDDISGSFNGVTTTFPLRVSGVAPVPFPISSNQCLISVGGVVQRPDDSGTEGFRISGTNIIFSSAPAGAADFFGVILAGADYVNVGANFPSGSATVPSITFDSDLDTGIYNPNPNELGFTTSGTARLILDSNGQLRVNSLGSAAAPVITFNSDPNTGIYSPGTDQVAISTNGAGRLFVDSSGRVGVGTATPSYPLSIFNSASNFIQFSKTGDAVVGSLIGRANVTDELRIQNSENAPITLSTNNLERARITSDGKLGLGTASPSSIFHAKTASQFNATLAVTTPGIFIEQTGGTVGNGNYSTALTLGKINSGRPGAAIASVQTSADEDQLGLAFLTHAGASSNDILVEAMRITHAGLVGIGTTSPVSILHVSSDTSVAGGNPRFTGTASARLELEDAGVADGSRPFQYIQSDDGSLVFGNANRSGTSTTGSSEHARIDSSGRLLVGTSTSTNNTRLDQKLAVVSTGSGNYPGMGITGYSGTVADAAPFLDFLRSRGTTDGSFTEVVNNDTLGYLVFRGADGAGWSDAALIKGEADGDWTTSGDTTDSPGRLTFYTTADGAGTSTERMRITSGGAVLVGGTSSTGIGKLETPSIQTWQTTNANANVFRLAKYVLGGGTQTILSITVPAAAYFISIEATFIGSRAPTSNVGTSRIAKEHYLISRNGSGSDVVLDSNVNSLDFEVASTTAGGTNNKDVMGASIQRGGAEANTDPQVVTITLDSGVNTSSTGQTLGIFDIMVLGGTSGLGIA